MNKLIQLFLISIVLSGCGMNNKYLTKKNAVVSPAMTEKEENQWNTMTGKWYGKSDLEGNKKREWLMDRKKDGNYLVEFITTDENGLKDKNVEMGEWGISGNIYFTIFKSQIHNGKKFVANPSDPSNRDTYKILKLTDKMFKYKHIRTHEKFEVIKEEPDFELKKH